MANILECCKEFEKYLKTTKDEPMKWHEGFARCFKSYMTKKPNLPRAETEVQKMHGKLCQAKKTWTAEEYKKIFTAFKPEHSDSEIDAPRIAGYFNKTFPAAIANSDAFSQINGHAAVIISKYLNAADIANLEKASKTFHTTPDKFKYNPVPLINKNVRDLFPNIETQYVYGPDDMIFDDGKIKEHHILDFCDTIGAFSGRLKLKNVTISNEVKEIPGGAFEKCKSLNYVTIPEGVTTIDDRAFAWCSNLKSITIPKGVTMINDRAFEWCLNLKSITIPKGVTMISRWTFSNCQNLKSITIPKSVTKIGTYAFRECSKDLELVFDEGVNDNLKFTFENSPFEVKTIKHRGNLSVLKKSAFIGAYGPGIVFTQI